MIRQKPIMVNWEKKSHTLAPAQRAAGGCSPLKAIPDREPAAGAFNFCLIDLEVQKSKVNARCNLEREIHDFYVDPANHTWLNDTI